MDEIKRGDIYFADLCPVVGSEQGGVRPGINHTKQRRKPLQPYCHCGGYYRQEEKAHAHPCVGIRRRVK